MAIKISKEIRLPEDSYFTTKFKKDLIVLHHTVGGSARSTFEYWRTDKQHIGTAYIVERDGAVYEVFPPECWAYHLGLKTTRAVDKRSIGIEIASEGALLERDGKYYSFGRLTEATRFQGPVFDYGKNWRGYRYFAQYTQPALDAAVELVAQLLAVYSIPKQTPADHAKSDLTAYTGYQGVLAHCHLREDKTDVHPGFAWAQMATKCDLQFTSGKAEAGKP